MTSNPSGKTARLPASPPGRRPAVRPHPADTYRYRYEAVAADLRRLVLEEKHTGEFLPPEVQLAERHGVNRRTLRQAMAMLVAEGLVHRQRGSGTVVADRLATGEFALVLAPEGLMPGGSMFYALTVKAVIRELTKSLPSARTRICLGAAGVGNPGFPATLDLKCASETDRLRGVITFKHLFDLGEELERRAIPVVKIGRGSGHAVTMDSRQILRTGLRHLHAAGCRRVGMIFGRSYSPPKEADGLDAVFLGLARQLRMACRPAWLQGVEQRVRHMGFTERDGYELTAAIWRESDRPDGLLIPDDVLCCGALRFFLQKGLRLPDDLRLVAQSIEGVELPYHKPVTRVEVSPDQVGTAAVQLMLHLLQHSQAQRKIVVPCRLVRGETT